MQIGPILVASLFLCCACAGCGAPRPGAPGSGAKQGSSAGEPAPPAATIAGGKLVLIHGGKIYTGAPHWDVVEALLVQDGMVVTAGPLADLRALAAQAVREIDLQGGYAMPGLHDAHGHLLGLGTALIQVDLQGSTSFADVVERVRARAKETPAGEWIEGRGWDHTRWPGAEFPHHAALSQAIPDHPVLLDRVDGHAAIANQAALERAGLWRAFDSETAIEGGRVHLDQTRFPSGVLIDAAVDRVRAIVPSPSDSQVRERLLLAQAHLLELGLVAMHDMGSSPQALRILRKLEASGGWHLRVISYLSGDQPWQPSDLRLVPRVRPSADRFGRVLLAGVKLYADGALGSRGAALLEPYADEPSQSGLLLASREVLAQRLKACAKAGLQPAIHAIGDRANRMVLDLYADWIVAHANAAGLRPRIEHAQMVAAVDVPRFAALGVIPSMQPTHATSDMRWAQARVGAARLEGLYAWRSLAPELGSLALGSDFPVESASPLEGLYAARTRQDAQGEPPGGWLPLQCLTADQAAAGYTLGAARAARLEQRLGCLREGFAADVSVFDVDPLDLDAARLLAGQARAVIIDGVVVWKR